MARESNLLVLDEPTNDLDVETLDLLQELLDDYDGTVILVSHDRDFLDRVTWTISAYFTVHISLLQLKKTFSFACLLPTDLL